MYSAIWRLLPGDRMTRALVSLGLVLAVAALLWYVVFPWAEPRIQFDHTNVDSPSIPASAPASTHASAHASKHASPHASAHAASGHK